MSGAEIVAFDAVLDPKPGLFPVVLYAARADGQVFVMRDGVKPTWRKLPPVPGTAAEREGDQ